MFQIRAEQFAAIRRKKIGDALIGQLAPVAGEARWDEQKVSVVLTDPLGNRSYLGFDPLGFIARYTSPLGRTWQLANASDGKLLNLASPSGHSTGLRYNEAGLVDLAASTTHQPVRFHYTPLRQFVGSVYADGTQEILEYTPWNAPARLTGRNGLQTICTYDEHKRLTAFTDGNGNTTRFEYSLWNRPDAAFFPNGTAEFYRYDHDGRLSELVQGDVELAAKLNARGHPLLLQYSDGLELEFACNDAGLVTAARQGEDATAMDYNERGQLVRELSGEQSHEFAFDPVGRMTGLNSGGRQVAFAWDEDSRLIGFTDWNGGVHGIAYAEADAGSLATGANGVRCATALQPDGKVRSVQVSSAGQAIYSLSCAYDGETRVSALEDSVFGGRTYTYDPEGQLLGALGGQGNDETFRYDGAGNITSLRGQSAAYDAANQLVATTQEDLQYDSRGNLIARTGVYGAWAFRYNDRNQMVASISPAGVETVYAYDAFGRRTLKRTGDLETRFAWAGEWMVAEEVVNLRTGGASRQEYLYHPETHVPLATCIDGQVYSYHADHLGTPRAMTGPDGSVVWLADIAPFGQAEIAVERARNPLRFPGQYFDPETGLHYNRFRYYSPLWGRYTTRDPLGFRAGPNFYTYVGGDPLNKTDRLGLSFWGAVAGVAAGIAVGVVVVLAAPEALTVGAIVGVALLAGALSGAAQEGVNEAVDGQHVCWPCIAKAAAIGAALNVVFLGLGVAAKGVAGALERAAARQAEEEAAQQAEKLAAEQAATKAVPRLPQDVNVDPNPPDALPLDRPVGQNANQNAMVQQDIQAAQADGATDIRVNQQQVNADGERVGTNRPDLQYTDKNGQRQYIEYDTSSSDRGPGHEQRLNANDPNGNVTLKTVD